MPTMVRQTVPDPQPEAWRSIVVFEVAKCLRSRHYGRVTITQGEWAAIDGELHLVRYLAHSGLTALRRADFQNTGAYFEAFFALTVSMERAAKLALAIDHRLATGAFPTDSQLRAHGHGLVALEAKVDGLVSTRSLALMFDPPSGQLDLEVLQLLDDFANASKDRYYNLSYLPAASSGRSYDGPPGKWVSLMRAHLTAKEIALTTRQRSAVDAASQIDATGQVLVRQSKEDGSSITTLAAGQAHLYLNQQVQKRGAIACIHHLRYLMDVLRCMDAEAHALQLPHVWDYFTLLLNEDSYLAKRRTFS